MKQLSERARILLVQLLGTLLDNNVRLDSVIKQLRDLPDAEKAATQQFLDANGGISIVSMAMAPPWMLESMNRKEYGMVLTMFLGEPKVEQWALSLLEANPDRMLSFALTLVRTMVRIHGPVLMHDLIAHVHEVLVDLYDQSSRLKTISQTLFEAAKAAKLAELTDVTKKNNPDGVN